MFRSIMCVYKKEKLLKGEEDLSVHSTVEKLDKNFMLVKLKLLVLETSSK